MVCVIHKNVPSILSQITTVLSESGANIENLASKSKKDWAYTMLDVTGNVQTDVVKKLESAEGIVKVRVL